MASNTAPPQLPHRIRRALSGLRWRIRAYVLLEGLSVAVIWICLTFWAGMALDYLPVLLGADEMPRAARAVVLSVIGLVLAYILYRWILRRAFVRLADRSMAILLERRHVQFHDSLITAVELTGRDERQAESSARMLADTEEDALRHLERVRLGSIFDARPLLMSLTGALILVASIGGALAAEQRFHTNLVELGFRRLYLLENEPWPRNAAIEVVGVQVQRDQATTTDVADLTMIAFQDGRLKVARGSSVSLLVRADAGAKVVPESCSIHYRLAEGDRGRVSMTRVGRIRDGYQTYRYDGKPLKGILGDLQFDVVGFDHRVRGFEIEVVDSPVVIEATLACEFPSYMVNEALSSWLPRTIPLTTATQLPMGTRFTLRARTNKALQQVVLRDLNGDEPVPVRVLEDEFEFDVDNLAENLSLEATLLDVDNVLSEKPYRIYVVGIEDQPPTVNVRLQGIGSAVTPDVIIPIRGRIDDDYDVAASRFEILVNDSAPTEMPFRLGVGGVVETAIDFREQRGLSGGIVLKVDDKLHLTVKATDKYDLGSQPHVGQGDHYQLEVVAPDRLLSMLEARELGLRRRFEQIKDEVTEMRQSLVRVRSEGPATASSTTEPADLPAGSTAQAAVDRMWSLRLLRAQRAEMQSEKSAQEILGVAASFGDIREELTNNRVDTQDRKQRIQDQIVAPLQAIGEGLFPELDLRLAALVAQLETLNREQPTPQAEDEATVSQAAATIQQTDEILLAIDSVLQSMLDIEDYNELLDRVRNLIADQEGLLDGTKKVQKQQVLDLLQ